MHVSAYAGVLADLHDVHKSQPRSLRLPCRADRLCNLQNSKTECADSGYVWPLSRASCVQSNISCDAVQKGADG